MNKEVLEFFTSLRNIFGVCPNCNELFRLSDCKIYRRSQPVEDWKEKLDNELDRLSRLEEKVKEKIAMAREQARDSGRKEADKLVKKIDPIFRPLKLNPNDAKVIFHPVDFVIFNGMNGHYLKNIVLLDKHDRTGEHLKIQKSIHRAIEKNNYEWLTMRVNDEGSIVQE